MQHFVKKLRNKSEGTRIKIAIGVSLIITILLAVGWVLSLNGKFKEKKEKIPNETSPFSVLQEFFSSGVSSISELNKERKSFLKKDSREDNSSLNESDQTDNIDEIDILIEQLNADEPASAENNN